MRKKNRISTGYWKGTQGRDSATQILGIYADGAFAQKVERIYLGFPECAGSPLQPWEDGQNQNFAQVEDSEEEPVTKLDWDILGGGNEYLTLLHNYPSVYSLHLQNLYTPQRF